MNFFFSLHSMDCQVSFRNSKNIIILVVAPNKTEETYASHQHAQLL